MNQDNENKEIDAKSQSDSVESAEQSDVSECEVNTQADDCFFAKAKEGIVKFGKAAWAYIKQAKIEIAIIFGLLILDLVTKALIAKFMYVGQSITLIPDFLYITYVRNTKAAFGSAFGLEKVLSDNAIRIIFLIITVIAVCVFCYLLYRLRKRHILMRISIALIISGALGNFVDRLVFHYVRDFVEFVFFGCNLPLLGKSFPVFNVADIGLTVGVILFLIYFIAIYKEPKAASKLAAQKEDNVSADEVSEEPKEETIPAEDNSSSAEIERKDEGGSPGQISDDE